MHLHFSCGFLLRVALTFSFQRVEKCTRHDKPFSQAERSKYFPQSKSWSIFFPGSSIILKTVFFFIFILRARPAKLLQRGSVRVWRLSLAITHFQWAKGSDWSIKSSSSQPALTLCKGEMDGQLAPMENILPASSPDTRLLLFLSFFFSLF